MKSDTPGPPPVSVFPRKPTNDYRPIIAVSDTHVLVERTGEIHSADQLPFLLLSEPPSFLVCERASALLAYLNTTALSRVPGWQYRVTPVVRRTYKEHRRKVPTESHDVIVTFLGWRTGPRKTHYHYPIDPVTFTGQTIRRLVPVEEAPTTLAALLVWGQDVRGWCREHGLKLSSGSGALAVQLLKDPRFYPDARRKVPQATNERARPQLPGNHYELFVPERTYHTAYYIDMHAAHHSCARDITFPSANGLLARGRFRDPPTVVDGQPWLSPTSRGFRSLLASHGLLLIRLQSPHLLPSAFPPPYMKHPGTTLAYVYTNELPLIRELGGIVEGIEAAWTSWTPDEGLGRFARWALAETAAMTDGRKRWGKSTLLAAYGMLAARPNEKEFGYADAVSGERKVYMTPGGPLPAIVKTLPGRMESPVVNVIHRGMIEAEVRKRSLDLARELTTFGCKVLCIYADSVIIDSGGQVPLIPEPWRVKSPLNRLQFFNPTSFASDEMVRLPGIPEGADRLSYRKMLSASASDARVTLTEGKRRKRTPNPRREHVPREIRRIVRAHRRKVR